MKNAILDPDYSLNPSHTLGAALTGHAVLFSPASTLAAPNPMVRPDAEYTSDFRVEDCTFISRGRTPFFILEPGYQLIFGGRKEDMDIRWIHTVLDKTETIQVPDIGGVEIRAVDEKEWADGEITETSIAYYAICKETGDVYDFGDDVWVHNADGSITHEGSWRAGRPDADGLAKPGIFLPGTFFVGARYFQQMAEGHSVERAENIADGLTVTVPAGTFDRCFKVFESNTLEDDFGATYKVHCPGVGLMGEGPLELVAYGFNIEDITVGPIPASPVKVERKITDDQAKQIALEKIPGEVIGVALERKLGDKRIVVEVIAAEDQTETDVVIDRMTGEILAVEK